MDLSPIAQAAVTAAAAAVAALAGLLIPMLPRLLTWLKVSINGADTTLLRAAIANAATNAALEATKQSTDALLAGMVAYLRTNLPETLKRIGVPDETLHAMCRAALAEALISRSQAA